MNLSEIEIAKLVAKTASEKKAVNPIVLDIRGLSVIADYFVICNGNSETQVQAITKEIKDKVNEEDINIVGIEGISDARWVLMDLGDVIVHIFHKEERDFYKLERLWKDAPQIEFEEIIG